MKLTINADKWALAKEHFLNNPAEKKFIPTEYCHFYFIKTNKNQILALARKKYRAPFLLGEGTFGTVVSAQNEAGVEFACKMIDPDLTIPEDESIEVMQHLNILKDQMTRPKKTQKTSKNPIRLSSKKKYLILELAPGKRLYDHYDKSTKLLAGFTNLQTDMIALQCCIALLEYHQKRVIHGDLSLKNIHLSIIGDDIVVTLVDQGFSLLLPEGCSIRFLTTMRGTIDYAAPEIYGQKRYSFESDIFALGTILGFLNRPDWAACLKASLPNDRFTLFEIISLILQKISNDNTTLSAPFELAYKQGEALVLSHYRKKLQNGLSPELLLRGQVYGLLFQPVEIYLLALHLCIAYHQTIQTNPCARINGFRNFIITNLNDQIKVRFDPTVSIINLITFPADVWASNRYTEKSAVFSLGVIFNALGIILRDVTHENPARRPSLIGLMSLLLVQTKKMFPVVYSTKEIEAYIRHAEAKSASDDPSQFYSFPLFADIEVSASFSPNASDDEWSSQECDHKRTDNTPNSSNDDLSNLIANVALRPPVPPVLIQFAPSSSEKKSTPSESLSGSTESEKSRLRA